MASNRTNKNASKKSGLLPPVPGKSALWLSPRAYNRIRTRLNNLEAGQGEAPFATRHPDRVRGWNETGTEIAPFTLVVLEGWPGSYPVTPDADQVTAFWQQHNINIVPADSGTHNDPDRVPVFGITQVPIETGASGWVKVSGVSTAWVEFDSSDGLSLGLHATPGLMTVTDDPQPSEIPLKLMERRDRTALQGLQRYAKVLIGSSGGAVLGIPADFEQVGGGQGTGTAEPSWTYKVTDARLRGTSPDAFEGLENVNPAIDPHQHVRHIGQMTQADFGEVWKNPAGNWEIMWCNEQSIVGECDPPPGGPTS